MDAIDRGEFGAGHRRHRLGQDVVADYAVARALARGGKAFYTTPSRPCPTRSSPSFPPRYGDHRVGLLTGDVSHQAQAPIVVMTTEVLRNMLFARSSGLDGLRWWCWTRSTISRTRYRGSVWEEVLVLTPAGVSFVSLSATVANAADFGRWLASVRGPRGWWSRPIDRSPSQPPLRGGRAGSGRLGPPLAAERDPNPDGLASTSAASARAHGNGSGHPARTEVVEYLAALGHAAGHHLHLLAGPPVTTPPGSASRTAYGSPRDEERARIRELVEAAVERLWGRRPPHARIRAVVGSPRGRIAPTTPGSSPPSARPSSSASPRAC